MDNNNLYNEKELILRISEGDEQAFEVLFERWWDKIYSTAFIFSKSAALSQDIAQEVFLQIWRKRATLADIENPSAYLTVIARNMIFRKLSRINLETSYKNYVSSKGVISTPQADQEVLSKELQNALEEGINLMPLQQQRAFRLSRQQGLTHEEIAQQMGISRLTVKDYIVKAIAFLRKHLQHYGLPVILFLLG